MSIISPSASLITNANSFNSNYYVLFSERAKDARSMVVAYLWHHQVMQNIVWLWKSPYQVSRLNTRDPVGRGVLSLACWTPYRRLINLKRHILYWCTSLLSTLKRADDISIEDDTSSQGYHDSLDDLCETQMLAHNAHRYRSINHEIGVIVHLDLLPTTCCDNVV